MNILVVSNIEWSNQNAFGNTVSNWLEGLPGADFASIYTRNSMPSNTACTKYLSIPFPSILKNFLTPEKIGRAFTYAAAEQTQPTAFAETPKKSGLEKKLIQLIHAHHFSWAYKVQELAFKSMRWYNQRFKQFVQDFHPDIVFSFITSAQEGERIVNAVLDLVPQCKFVAYIADDVYDSAKTEKERQTILRQVETASLLYGASEELCAAYRELFHKPITPLYKGCLLEPPKAYAAHNPLELVYAGNLYYGRSQTLGALADAIAQHNQNSSCRMHLNLYSASQPTAQELEKLNRPGVSTFHGARPYQEIKSIMQDADLVLHVESFDEAQKQLVRYSFSTKIIDCLQSQRVFLCIGPNEISSVRYARRIPGAVVIDNLSAIESTLQEISKMDLEAQARQTYQFAKEQHEIHVVQQKIQADLKQLFT